MTRRLALALLAGTALVPAAAHAQDLPTGGTVMQGGATIGAPSGGAMTITQSSDKAVINWNSFSIGADNRVDILQPDAQSALLNRVTGDTGSVIAGQLHANGRVFLVNPNGIMITESGSVNAAGFVASTLDLSDDAFMRGGEIVVTGPGGSVSNRGRISIVEGGFAALLGGRVDNAGLIYAPLGKVALGAGTRATLDFSGDGFLQVAVPGADTGIAMSGRITADGGAVILAAAQAKAAARSTVNLSGVIEARGVSGTGGHVVLTGDDIALTGARIDVSGASGGGSVRIGGDRQGGGSLAHADTLSVDAATRIAADSTTSGNGGDIVLWSDSRTRFAGTISATGAGGGDGGNAEVSSKGRVDFTGRADLRGARFGTLLLDPLNVVIAADPTADPNYTNPDYSFLSTATVEDQLRTSSVYVTTSGFGGNGAGDITVASPITWTSTGVLQLQAERDINFASGAAITAPAGYLYLDAGRNIGLLAPVIVNDLTINAGNASLVSATLPTLRAANFTLGDNAVFLRALSGDGSQGTPYLLADSFGLAGMWGFASSSFTLANDISWDFSSFLRPVGTAANPFTGRFDGAGHTITNLRIAGNGNSGLFGVTASGATIANVGLINAYGGFDSVVGALVGTNYGSITNSYATGSLYGGGNNRAIGGLVGINYGAIDRSWASGLVFGEVAGGLVGLTGTGSSITNSYASTTVYGVVAGGGLVGRSEGGSIAGIWSSSYVDASAGTAGGLIGVDAGGTLTNAYWDTEESTQSDAIGARESQDALGNIVRTTPGAAPGATGLTTAEARSASSYTGFDFGSVWYQAGDLRPILRSEYSTTIRNLHQLELMALDLSASYTLATDLDLNGNGNAGYFRGGAVLGPEIVTIGSAATPFTGSLDGAGHTLSSLNLYRPSDDLVGLFGSIGASGRVSNLTVSGYVVGRNGVGLLAGRSDGTIDNVTVIGQVYGGDQVGGMAGQQGGTITNSIADAYVFGANDVGGLVGLNAGAITGSRAGNQVSGTQNIGGLAGRSQGSIVLSSSDADVRGSDNSGGLVGNVEAGTVDRSYATGEVVGSTATGGLAGVSAGTVTQSYASANVYGNNTTGGLVGLVSGGSISNAYTTGTVSAGGNDKGGFAGIVAASATISQAYSSAYVAPGGGAPGGFAGTISSTNITQSYWDSDSSGQSAGWGVNDSGSALPGLTGLTSAQARDAASYSGWNFGTGGMWFQMGDMRPILRSEAATAGADGVVTIGNAHQLQLAALNLAGSYRLAGDIGAFETSAVSMSSGVWGEAGFISIGSDANPFSGDFDGAGHVIAGLTVYKSSGGLAGLFGRSTGAIHDVGLQGGQILGGTAGALVGRNDGTVTRAYSDLAVSGDDAGGLIGQNNGTVTLSYASGEVRGSASAGGLIGRNAGTVGQSYASGGVTFTGALPANNGTPQVAEGGLIGRMTAGTVDQTYATGLVATQGGGLIGLRDGGTVANSYWNTGSSGRAVSSGGIGLTDAQFHDVTAFRTNFAGFDFDGIWAPPSTGAYSSDGLAHAPELYATSPIVAVETVYASRAYGDTRGYGFVRFSGLRTNDFVGLNGDIYGGPPVTANVGSYSGAVGNPYFVSSPGVSYRYVYVPGPLEVSPRTLLVSATPSTVYGDAPITSTSALSFGYAGLVNGDSIASISFTPPVGSTSDAGYYGFTPTSVDWSSGLASNYYVYFDTSYYVAPRPLTIASGALSSVYGNAPVGSISSFTITAGNLVNGDQIGSFGVGTGVTSTTGVGTYSYRPTDPVLTSGQAGNYAFTYADAPYTVTPRAITVTADPLSRIYGDANPILTYTVGGSGLVNGDTLGDLATSATQASNVGSYAITQGSLGNANYAIAYTGANLTITPRGITVNADPLSRIYGDANPALTYSVGGAGLVNGDTLSGSLATSATQVSNVGSYAITQGSLAAGSNYALTYTGANLMVTPRGITVAADPLSRIYGDANSALTYSVGGAGLVNGDTLSGSLATSATQASNIGSYAITQGNLAAGSNYALTYAGATLMVTPRGITVAADPLSRIYGDANPALTYSVGGAGLVNGDTLSGSLATSATQASNIGSYAITQGNLAAGSNYALTYAGATLMVTPRGITVAADPLSRIYGDANPALTYSVGGAGLVNGDTLSGSLATSATQASNVGSYAITQGDLAAGSNYALTYTGAALAVTPRFIVITADSLSRTFGLPNPPLTYTVGGGGLVNGDTLSGALATASGPSSAPGTYGITQGSLAASANYAVSYVAGLLTIQPSLTIDASLLAGTQKRDSFAEDSTPQPNQAMLTGDGTVLRTPSHLLRKIGRAPVVVPAP